MKTLNYFTIILFLIIAVYSCGKDDGNEKITDSQLYGEWIFKSVQTIDSSWVLTDTGTVDGNVILSIKPDGNLSSGSMYVGKFTLVDNNGSIEANLKRGDFSGAPTPWWMEILMEAINKANNYSVNDNKLKIFYEEDKQANFSKK